ncbi:MAG: NADH-quinone oxidoreductase subunit L [Peptococcaceae bacterium]|jgi:NADH-quinone oxidoreductase subunit L|nr:NADH-quinone oxidoreductase subunit L [Peptococcaceae bacterium]MDH7525694.1 NADH-quinone oxidoreductase subunit L [Peptococcaceae bacterium]
MIEKVWLVPFLPLAAFVFINFVVKKYRAVSALSAIAAIGGSFAVSAGIAREVLGGGITMEKPVELGVQWLNLPGIFIEMGALIDPLTVVMLLVVTFISLLIFIYSVGYMHEDPGFSRYFSYLVFFTFSMLGLVISNNYLQMYVFWELVGLSSYLLIGFWYQKNSAADANKKAFITNRVADFGFLLGILVLFSYFGTFNFGELAVGIRGCAETGFLTLAGILVFLGPVGKSGQFPLHVWLPDAMEGPTPVSALIHAATMVAAGVYLLARGYILFASSAATLLVVAVTGGFTALFAASIALVQRDMKRILAYSTLSQLGYMVLAMGVGSMTAGMFHLTTHAFFKALMFLCAGSVIHALHEQDIMKMGGLSGDMRITTVTMIIGGLAIAGIPPFAGFWSKDEILSAAYANGPSIFGYNILYIMAALTAFMTAFYMFRMIFLAFFGEKRGEHHPHESPPVMTIPLIVLAFFAVTSGLLGAPFIEHGFSSFVYFGEAHHPEVNWPVMWSSILLGIGGIAMAWLIYIRKVIPAESIARAFPRIYRVLDNKYYIDELYLWFFDNVVLRIAAAFNWSDRNLVDGTAHAVADGTRGLGRMLRYLQTGNLQVYALVIFAAVVLIVLFTAVPVIGGVR